MKTAKPKAERPARRPTEAEPWGRLRAAVVYARRWLTHFEGAPGHAAAAGALAPAIAIINATPANTTLTDAEADTIHHALDEFRRVCNAFGLHATSDARAEEFRQEQREEQREEQRRKHTAAADAANEAKRTTAAARRDAMNAEAAELEREGHPRAGHNRILSKRHKRTMRQIRNIRAAPIQKRK